MMQTHQHCLQKLQVRSDVRDGSEDGGIEFAAQKAGTQLYLLDLGQQI